MTIVRGCTLAALLALVPAGAMADTLYVAAPPPVGPGHPLRLGPDHRAAQVGDLLHVLFNFSVNSFSSDVSNNSKQFALGASPGTGNFALGFLRFPSSIGGQSGTQSTRTENGQTSFAADMEAQVINVLPSGVMEITGDQRVIINGQNQVLHVVGYVRPEDIDATDSILSTHIANVQATFSGNFQEKNVGLIRRILGWLF